MGDVCGGGGYIVSAGDVLDDIVVFAVVVMGNFFGNSDDLPLSTTFPAAASPAMKTMRGEVGCGGGVRLCGWRR